MSARSQMDPVETQKNEIDRSLKMLLIFRKYGNINHFR